MKFMIGLTLAVVLAGTAAAASFTFADFSNPSGINLVGDAALTANRLRLTPALENQVGAAWLNNRVNVQGGFVTSFQFQITDRGGYKPDWEPNVFNDGADGLTFVIQNAGPMALGLYASGIGYYGIPRSLAIEFDTWNNKPSYCEPNGNHIAVQSLGNAENHPEHCPDADGAFLNPTLGIALPSKDMSNGAIYDVMITYQPGLLKIFFDNMALPILSVNVDLGSLFTLENGTGAFIGFTSSTGGAWENHDIVNWSYTNVPEPGTFFMAGAALLFVLCRRR
ncbi:MAG: PEP-CTERM sorting domain-containing protein [Acidobacteria bacterium]|nr:PEP-CTERM sorting domain-containing protein [Acidobacteriota bacterium]